MAMTLMAIVGLVGAGVGLYAVAENANVAREKNANELLLGQMEAKNRADEIKNQYDMDQKYLAFAQGTQQQIQAAIAETNRTIQATTEFTKEATKQITSGSFLGSLTSAQKNQVLNMNAYPLPTPAREVAKSPLNTQVRA